MLLSEGGLAGAAAHRRQGRLRRRFFVALLLTLLAACGPEMPAPTETTPSEPRLYVMARTDGGWNLATAEVRTGEVTPLLEGISGFAPAPEGAIVVLDAGRSLARWDGERLHPLWDCAGECRDPVMSSTGAYLAWSEEAGGEREGWVLALPDGAGRSLGALKSRLVWNPAGDQLAAITSEGLTLWSATGARVASLNLRLLEAPPSWSPAGDRLAVINAAGTAIWLVPQRLTLNSEMTLLQPLIADDQTPEQIAELAWSPGGEQMALLRRRFFPPEEPPAVEDGGGVHEESSGADALGSQPWLFALSEGHFTELPGDGGASFARPVWSADGRWLAAVRLPMGVPDPQPEVWVWEVETERLVQRFPGTAAPAWALPSGGKG